MTPKYNLDKIKFATDGPTFEKAVELVEAGKITEFSDQGNFYTAIVLGTNPYSTWVQSNRYDEGSCQCYLGQKNTLCKHMVAVAIYAITGGQPLTVEEKQLFSEPTCSGLLGELPKEDFNSVKKGITEASRYIKPYNGPSRIWFTYQSSLLEGCRRLSKIISDLPISQQTAKLLVDLLLKLDEKMCRGGVDDSDGIVGDFINETVQVLIQFAKLDPSCIKTFQATNGRRTSFGWERPLLELLGDSS